MNLHKITGAPRRSPRNGVTFAPAGVGAAMRRSVSAGGGPARGGGSPRISPSSLAAVNRGRSSSSAAADGDEDQAIFDGQAKKKRRAPAKGKGSASGKTKGSRGQTFSGHEVERLLDIYAELLPIGQQEREHAADMYNEG